MFRCTSSCRAACPTPPRPSSSTCGCAPRQGAAPPGASPAARSAAHAVRAAYRAPPAAWSSNVDGAGPACERRSFKLPFVCLFTYICDGGHRTQRSLTTTNSAWLPWRCGGTTPQTRAPGRRRAAGPARSTVPTKSRPGTNGNSMSSTPSSARSVFSTRAPYPPVVNSRSHQ